MKISFGPIHFSIFFKKEQRKIVFRTTSSSSSWIWRGAVLAMGIHCGVWLGYMNVYGAAAPRMVRCLSNIGSDPVRRLRG
jgi:bacteriorhodopsin